MESNTANPYDEARLIKQTYDSIQGGTFANVVVGNQLSYSCIANTYWTSNTNNIFQTKKNKFDVGAIGVQSF